MFVGREARRLDAIAPRAIYVVDDAKQFVIDRISRTGGSQLTPGELEQLLVAHLRRLHDKGLHPDNATDQRQSIEQPLILDEIDETAYMLGELETLGIITDDSAVAEVLALHLQYLDDIGAVGPPAEP